MSSARYILPAEWEPHEATWLAWPLNRSDWPGKFTPIPWVYGEIVRRLIEGERVRIIVASAAHEAGARRVLGKIGADSARIEFLRLRTNRGWMRDCGLFFVHEKTTRRIVIARFAFNAWAKYSNWRLDNEIPARIARTQRITCVDASVRRRRVVLEGGSIDTNGRGTLLTTEECLLDQSVQARNPGMSRAKIEAVLRDHLGATNVLWLGKGIAGDDTHGHVDDLCRFVNPTTVVLVEEKNPRDANYRPLQENRERLSSFRLQNGSKLNVIPLPMPAPLCFDGMRLPASYANFYIANAAVLVPTFNDPHDRIALGILADIFRDRPVIGIHAVDLVWGLGTLHCLTHEQPAAPAVC